MMSPTAKPSNSTAESEPAQQLYDASVGSETGASAPADPAQPVPRESNSSNYGGSGIEAGE